MMGLNRQRSHEENRAALCLLCFKRGKLRKISKSLEIKIKESVPKYDSQNDCLPCVLCINCNSNVYRGVKIKEQPDFSSFVTRKETRGQRSASKNPCECHLCNLARLRSGTNLAGNFESVSPSKPVTFVGSPNSKASRHGRVTKVEKRCNKCLSKLKPGATHRCNKTSRLNNIATFLEESESDSSKSKQQLAAKLLKQVGATKKNAGDGKNKSAISLSQLRGKPLNVCLNAKESNTFCKNLLTAEDFNKIKTSFQLSCRTTVGIASVIRVAVKKRNIVEPNLKKNLQKLTHNVDEFFKVEDVEFISEKKSEETKSQETLVFCNDLEGFLKFVKETRQESSVHLKFGIDAGQGFLKVCVSVLPDMTDEDSLEEPNSTRQKYSEGVLAKKFLKSGVKKLFILGIAAHVQENHANASKLWEKLNIKNFDATIATDLKLANIIVGIMQHSCSHPCTWCDAKKSELYEQGEYRTVGSALKNYVGWVEAGAQKKDAHKFKNHVHSPILDTDEDRLFLDLIPPPELHLLLGVVNTIFEHMHREFKEDAERWENLCHVKRRMTHGSPAFDGNSCSLLLKKVDLLRRDSALGCLKYVDAFQAFKSVVDACFSRRLEENFEENIVKFKDSYMSLNISVTPKVHAVFFHVADFCKRHQRGLAFYSEQAMESVHFDFQQTWEKFKVSETNPDYCNALLRAVCVYNSCHL